MGTHVSNLCLPLSSDMKFKKVVVLFLLLLPALSFASSTNMLSNYGTSFYLGFIRQAQVSAEPRILVGTNSTSNVKFVVSSADSSLYLGVVTSASSTTVPLPISSCTMNSSYSERHKGVHISADAPIYVVSSLYAINGAAASHLVLPGHEFEGDKYEYIAVSYQARHYWSLVLLIGNKDNTSVTVVSSVTIQYPLNPQDPNSNIPTIQAGVPHTVILNRLQTLLLGANEMTHGDMTGTRIISNKPLTVISGNECAFIPTEKNDCERIAIQIPPVVTWGKEFLLPPIFGRTSGQLYKVVSANSEATINLTCTISTHQPMTLADVGSFVEINTSSSDYCHLESSDPVLVVQSSYGVDTDGKGDPSMILVPSIDQYSNKFFFRTLTGYDQDGDALSHFLSVVAASADLSISQIEYDGQPISSPWSSIHSSNGSVVGYGCGFTISAGDHSLQHINTNKSLLGLAYGYMKHRAYGFPVGITYKQKSSVEFSQMVYTLSENQGIINIDVVYVGVPETNVNIKLVLKNESNSISNKAVASQGADFQLLSEEVTFFVGETVKSVSLEVYDDEWVEFKEMFSIRLLPEDGRVLGTHSTFFIESNDQLHVGISSAVLSTSPHYSFEICVSITNGVLQSDITLRIILTAAVQRKDDREAVMAELQFSQHIIKHCEELNLLSLVGETELTHEVTLDASLAVSDALQVTLSPSTTVIDFMTSTAHETTNTVMEQNTEAPPSLFIAVVIGALSLCFTNTIIAITVIAGCYCAKVKSRKLNSLDPPTISMTNHASDIRPHIDDEVYDEIVNPKASPLPNLPKCDCEYMHSTANPLYHHNDLAN